MKKLLSIITLGLLSLSVNIQAATPTVDVSTVTTFIDDQVSPAIQLIGGAVLILAVLVAGFRWMRRASS